MIRHATPILLSIVAALLGLAAATLSYAGDEPAPLPFKLENFELLPIHEIEWAVLLHEHPALVGRLHVLGKRMERIKVNLDERTDASDSGSRTLQLQLLGLVEEMRPHLVTLLDELRPFGIDEEVLAVLDDAPNGRRRLERHTLRLVLTLPDLTKEQRKLFERLVPATEGALLMLDGVVSRTEERTGEEDIVRLQKRFWRVVDATLAREQRMALRRRLPTKMAKYADLLGHVFVLPDLTPSQGARIKSLLVRLEAEAAPDTAAKERAERQLKDETLSSEVRRNLEREKSVAERRSLALMVAAWREGLEILTPDQIAELEAVPPLLTAKDRPGDLEHDFDRVTFLPEQVEPLQALKRRYGPLGDQAKARLARVESDMAEFGPDAPQGDDLEMRRAQVYGWVLREARDAAHALFGEILTPDQIVTWVLEPDPS